MLNADEKKVRESAAVIVDSILLEFSRKKVTPAAGLSALIEIIANFSAVHFSQVKFDAIIEVIKDNYKNYKELLIKINYQNKE